MNKLPVCTEMLSAGSLYLLLVFSAFFGGLELHSECWEPNRYNERLCEVYYKSGYEIEYLGETSPDIA